MRQNWLTGTAFLAVLILVGCRQGNSTPEVESPVIDTETRLNESIELDLAGWLKLPRSELAKQCREWETTIEKQQKACEANPGSVEILPKMLPKFSSPVLATANYSSKMGISVPPYYKEGEKDVSLAIHLARFGDHEAAKKLVDSENESMQKQLAGLKQGKNIPVEWTRLVGLVLASSQLKLAMGDVDGARQIVGIHTQLRTLLDKNQQAGPLGAVLLSMGKRALAKASEVWKTDRYNKVSLTEDIDKALSSWGSVPPLNPLVNIGTNAQETTLLLGQKEANLPLVFTSENDLLRAIDVLNLPIGGLGVRVIGFFFDSKEQLTEIQLAYARSKHQLYPETAHFVYPLIEQGGKAGIEKKSAVLQQQTFSLAETGYEVLRTVRSPAMGGIVRVLSMKNAPKPEIKRTLREFDGISLDMGFESARHELARTQSGPVLQVKDKPILDRLADNLHISAPNVCLLKRNKDADVIDSIEWAWPANENSQALAKILGPCWRAFGPGIVTGSESANGSFVAVAWQNPQTQAALRFPFADQGPVFVVGDRQPATELAARVKRAQSRDAADRKARLTANTPSYYLPRSPGKINDHPLDGLQLGMSKSQVASVLPHGGQYRKIEINQGTSILVLTKPEPTADHWARQVLVRYNQDKVSEIRVRYEEGPAKPKKGATFLDKLVKKDGAPATLPAPWAGLWKDLTKPGPVSFYMWCDDRTVQTYQQDQGGIEVVLKDRPLGDEEPARKWYFVSWGVPGCQLGDSRDSIEAKFLSPAAVSDGANVYRAKGTYEMLLVWYENNRARRIIAVHANSIEEGAKGVASALKTAWGNNLSDLGFIRRRLGASGNMLGAYFWHDDRVRVKTYVENTTKGARLFTEWTTWPIERAPQTTTANSTKKPMIPGS